MKKIRILILCKVVDNFGDIGVVYRLARAMSEQGQDLDITIAVSDLASFKAMAPQVDVAKDEQTFCGWNIIQWDVSDKIAKTFEENPPQIILECFQCGRPDWLENILFAEKFTKTVQIINIDYLTAEEYADDFHLLKSGTRKTCIKKINFMPGFTEKTGSLILDNDFMESLSKAKLEAPSDDFKVLVFSYEQDFSAIVQALKEFQAEQKNKNADFSVKAFVAPGRSSEPFLNAWQAESCPFQIERLDFLKQQEWDSLLCKMDFIFIRGEDSLSRACLAGIPFIWRAYPQDEDYHLVKLNALLARMEAYLSKEDFSNLSAAWNWYNGDQNIQLASGKNALKAILTATKECNLRDAFRGFSQNLIQNGNLAAHLLEYIDEVCKSLDL